MPNGNTPGFPHLSPVLLEKNDSCRTLSIMNITFVIADLAGGGAARVMSNIANYWANAGHTVTIVSFEDGEVAPFYFVGDDVQLVYAPRIVPTINSDTINNFLHIWRLRKAILCSSPDVVISFLDTVNVRTIFALMGVGVPVIVSERIHPGHWSIGRFWSTLRRLTYPLASSVVVQTQQIADFVGNWRLKDVRVIQNPVRAASSEEKNQAMVSPALIAVGRLHKQKKYDLLLRAFSKAVPTRGDWTLYIAGEGEMKPSLEKLISELKIEEQVVFLGHIADIDLAFNSADIFVLASSFEGFPCALSEAMAHGLPCLSTDCPSGPSELISHGENGILVPNFDEDALSDWMMTLMNDRELRERLGHNAREVVSTYSMEVVMKKWDNLLMSLSGRD